MPCQGTAVVWGLPGHSPFALLPCRAVVVPKERFLDADWSVASSLCHMIKTTKMANSLEMHSPLRQNKHFALL